MSVQSEMTAMADQVRRLSGETALLGISAMTAALTGVTSGIDTSDATAVAEDIAAGKTAYADGKKLEGSVAEYREGTKAIFASNYTEVSDDSAINFLCRGLNHGAKILRDGSYANVYVKKTEFGDASAADVAKGKTFTSSAGLNLVGTAELTSAGSVSVTDDGAGNVVITEMPSSWTIADDSAGNVVIGG